MKNTFTKTNKTEHYYLVIRDIDLGEFEKSEIRNIIHRLDYTDKPELIIKGINLGNYTNLELRQLIEDLDNLIHH